MFKLKLKMKHKLKKRCFVSGLTLMIALLFSSFIPASLQAQERISGTVTDASGIPLPGVSVVQKGTNRGASTDFDGVYSIELAPSGEQKLVFSYIGFKTVEISTNGKTTIDVGLE